jgi:hypothetical protein
MVVGSVVNSTRPKTLEFDSFGLVQIVESRRNVGADERSRLDTHP